MNTKPNQFRSLAAVGVLWLGLSAGCEPPDPCKNGECCGLDQMTFVRRVEGARAECGGIVFAFQEVINAPPLNTNQASALTCPTQQQMITAMHLKSNTTLDATGKVRLIDSTHAYPYRVWGRLYRHLRPGIVGPSYGIYLDKVESVY